jgi:hypothetical protein
MAQALPDVKELDVVLFHRDMHMPSSWLVLQVPLKGKQNQSNTYRIDLEKREDRGWFQMLPQERRIKDLLGLYGHVIYFPKEQEAFPVEDKDLEKLTLSQFLFQGAEKQKAHERSRWDKVNGRLRRMLRPLERWKRWASNFSST